MMRYLFDFQTEMLFCVSKVCETWALKTQLNVLAGLMVICSLFGLLPQMKRALSLCA